MTGMMKTPLKLFFLLMLALGLAGCSETLTSQSPSQVQPTVSVVSIDPIVGVPAEQTGALLQTIETTAEAQGVTVGLQETGTRYIYKGYISSIPGSDGNSIIHVWDLFDASGNRVHRVSGTVLVPQDGGLEAALLQVGQEAANGLTAFVKTQAS